MAQLTHIHTDDGSLAGPAVERRVRIAAERLYAAGFRVGDRVAITTPDPLEQLAALLGCWRLGLVACPLSHRDPPELQSQKIAVLNARSAPSLAGDSVGAEPAAHGAPPQHPAGSRRPPDPAIPSSPCASHTAMTDNGVEGSARHAQGDDDPLAPSPVTALRDAQRSDSTAGSWGMQSPKRGVGAEPHELPVPAFDATRDASVIFTSGSSGEPKGVVHSYAAHLASARGANANLPLGHDDRWLLSLPLCHVGGLAIVFRCGLVGADIVVPPARFDLAATILRHRVSHLSLVPTQLMRLLDLPDRSWVRSLRGVLLGGGPIPADLVTAALAAGVPVLTTYGLTEMASQVTCAAPGDPPAALATAGRLLADRELRVADDGEILVRGATLGRCYVSAAGETPLLADDGWYHSRDAGSLDADGRLTVTGRLDSRFISGGENIQPEAIERVLLDQPGVRRAIVVPRPHAEFGQRPVAYVDGDPTAETLRAAVAARLPGFMVPDAIHPWPAQDDTLKPSRTVFTLRARDAT